MDAAERKKKMIDTAMKVVAEKGLDSFSVAQAAGAANINEALVYRDFGTKENLLTQCFIEVNHEILELYQGENKINFQKAEDVTKQMYLHWKRFFDCLVEGNYKTLFYQQYRDSAYKMPEEMKRLINQYDVKTVFRHILSVYTKDTQNIDYLCTYFVDGSILFAKRVICGEILNNEETTMKVWHLLDRGMNGLSDEKTKE